MLCYLWLRERERESKGERGRKRERGGESARKRERGGERERERKRERKRGLPSISSHFIPQMITIARAGPKRSVESGTPSSVLFGYRGPRSWAIFYCFPWCINRELNRNWNNQGLSWYLYGIPASQVVSQHAVLQHSLLLSHF